MYNYACRGNKCSGVKRNSHSLEKVTSAVILFADTGMKFVQFLYREHTQSKPSPLQLYYLDHNIHIQYHDMFRL
jgi:hypothetical protein